MKKRIITDNLEWFENGAYKRNEIIERSKEYGYWYNFDVTANRRARGLTTRGLTNDVIEQYSEWFEDVEEKKYKILFPDDIKDSDTFLRIRFNRYVSIKQSKLIEQALNGELFTFDDMMDFINHGQNR